MKIKFSIKDWVSLKPNRDDLLTPSAAWWIFVVRIMITIMATAEGISWGYMGWSIGRNVSPVFAALLCGLFIFSVIWLVDATFMTLDTSLAFYERTIKGNVFSTLDKVKYIAKGFGGVGGRVAIVLGSYMVSAPFLAQLVFSYDIDGRIETLNMAKVAETRTGIVTSHDNKIDNFEKKLDELRASLIEETAGTGPSGIHGDGVVARSIRENISAVESQLDKATAEKEDELNDFDALDLDGIARKYKVEFLKPGIETESRVLTELM
ncbi:MAG: hypothetical protein C0608_02440 [Deltaproteobacteria bacterium]|nr:MAG: hypothetical protein C0608_02440 [Deltaproteobacteria bacterium]